MITFGAATDPGKQRQTNEDSLMAVTGEEAPPGVDGVFAVADGVGGRAAGAVASSIAVQELLAELRSAFPLHNEHPNAESIVQALIAGLTRAHTQVAVAALAEGRHGMGSTLTAAVVAGETLGLAHVGDSRAYLLRDYELRQLTADHSWVAEQVLAGTLTRAEAATHPQRNVITRALGVGCKLRIDTTSFPVRSNDTVLLTSDGIHGIVDERDIAAIIAESPPSLACQRLIQYANGRGGPDNCTAIVVKFG